PASGVPSRRRGRARVSPSHAPRAGAPPAFRTARVVPATRGTSREKRAAGTDHRTGTESGPRFDERTPGLRDLSGVRRRARSEPEADSGSHGTRRLASAAARLGLRAAVARVRLVALVARVRLVALVAGVARVRLVAPAPRVTGREREREGRREDGREKTTHR